MAVPTMQKQTARNLVLSANSQAAYGGVLADANMTYRASVDPSTVFSNPSKRYSDEGAIGHGTDFATYSQRTAWNTMATVKGMGGVDAWLLGLQLALLFGTDTVSGAGPYTHLFSIGMTTALAPCTTAYVEDTNDVHRKYPDMAAKSLSIDIPERGPIQSSLDMVGTGRFLPGTFSTALPAVPTQNYLLGSDVLVTLTPSGGGANILAGRQTGVSFKMDRGTAPFEASGDGLTAGSCQFGKMKFSVDLTVMAQETDDVNGYYESDEPMAIQIATNPAKQYQLILNFPLARIMANKLGNKNDLVAWGLSFDETTLLQSGATPALSATLINTAPSYLVPA